MDSLKISPVRNHFSYKKLLLLLTILCGSVMYSQQYPPETILTQVNYNPPFTFPDYLTSFTDENFGNEVVRITNLQYFNGDTTGIRHEYALNCPWNADGTLIQIYKSGESRILDGETFEIIGDYIDVERYWSNIDPDKTYYFYDNKMYTTLISSGTQTLEHDFSTDGYNYVSLGEGTGNLSNDDRLVALNTRKTNGQYYITLFNTETKTVMGEMLVGSTNLVSVKISQLGNYIITSGATAGTGNLLQGTNLYDTNFNFIRHLHNERPHADLGIDAYGNEVWVTNTNNKVRSFDLATGVETIYNYVSGGHVSCRALDRPGWAYVTDHGQYSESVDYESFREVFAVKLDGKPNGVITVNRFTKHYSDVNAGYYHQPHAVPNRDGSKVMFASNMEDSQVMNQQYAFAFIVQAPQSNNGVNANAGQDQNICEGSSATLTAFGGDTYLWNTGETTQSITVTPNTTTTYSVTAFVGSESDTDSVIVNVNPIPIANAGIDETICEGESITLSASGGNSYLWNTGSTSQSITVTPTTTTTYSVEVTTNGCSASDNVIVTVNPLPIIDAGTDVNINLGENSTLTASGGTTYLWNTGETTQSITVSPNTTTTYTVTGFVNGCEANDTVIVTVIDTSVTANAGADQTICEGEDAILTASGGITYLWTTGETSASITVNPNTTTTYTVTVFDATGTNSDTDDVIVNVNPLPIANAGTDQTISEGSSTTLTASGGNSYLWSTGETSQSIIVSPNVTTTYTVTAISNSCEDSDDVVVTVETEQVVANAGADVDICEGNSVTLTASGGTNYLWNTGETTQSITVNPNSTTNYTVIVSNEISSDTDDVTVTVNPIPVVSVSDDATILDGEYITLSASGANNYEWSNGATQPNIAVSPNITTTYEVTGYVNNCYDVKDVTVNVVEQVVVNAGEDISMCLGDEITLTATGSGADNYIWNTGDTTQSITVSPNIDTMYTVIASNSLDSEADDVLVSVNICDEEIIPEDEEFSYKVYIDSRISNDFLNVKLFGLKDHCDLYLFDISGKLMHTDQFEGNDGQEIVRTINTSILSDGIYVIKIVEKGNIHSKNLIIR